MRVCLTCLALAALVVCLPASATAQWSEDFDAYAAGSGIIGQGGWEGWDGNSSFDAIVTNALSRSGPNSLESGPDTDVVQEFAGIVPDMWIVSAWQYIPANATGDSYFILLNSYTPDGASNENWSTQLRFGGGVVESEFDASILPLIYDQWVEIRVEIDLTADMQQVFYGGALLTTKSWVDGVTGGGALNIAALDLFGNGADPVYYDDLDLSRAGSTPIEVATWGGIKERFNR